MNLLDMQLRSLFIPHEDARRADLFSSGRKLIHYTSAENAVRIIKNREIWLRNVRVMNDFMEVDHGFNLISRALTPQSDPTIEVGMAAVRSALNAAHQEIMEQALQLFKNWFYNLKFQTYVTCLSEHPTDEDQIGRLSMWRNYTAGQAGVGLVIDPTPLYSISNDFGAFSSPVFYFDDGRLNDAMLHVASKLREQSQLLRNIDRQLVLNHLFVLLRSLALCCKHPGFHEELEWRIMHTIGMEPEGALKVEVETVRGIPQRVVKLPLLDAPNLGVTGLTIPTLLQRVIIGPTQYQDAVAWALHDTLSAAGVEDPQSKIVLSHIPIRT